jgi:hypothetical protein
MDIDNIPYGLDFRDHLQNMLVSCDILLAVVGPNWAGTDLAGQARIGDEEDWVRIEVASALSRGIPVIPLLIDTTPMLKARDLPDDLRALAFRQAATIDTGRDFHAHVDRLLKSMDRLLETRPQQHTISASDFRLKRPPDGADIGQNVVNSEASPNGLGATDLAPIEASPEAEVPSLADISEEPTELTPQTKTDMAGRDEPAVDVSGVDSQGARSRDPGDLARDSEAPCSTLVATAGVAEADGGVVFTASDFSSAGGQDGDVLTKAEDRASSKEGAILRRQKRMALIAVSGILPVVLLSYVWLWLPSRLDLPASFPNITGCIAGQTKIGKGRDSVVVLINSGSDRTGVEQKLSMASYKVSRYVVYNAETTKEFGTLLQGTALSNPDILVACGPLADQAIAQARIAGLL